jgi:hypothetical protein
MIRNGLFASESVSEGHPASTIARAPNATVAYTPNIAARISGSVVPFENTAPKIDAISDSPAMIFKYNSMLLGLRGSPHRTRVVTPRSPISRHSAIRASCISRQRCPC